MNMLSRFWKSLCSHWNVVLKVVLAISLILIVGVILSHYAVYKKSNQPDTSAPSAVDQAAVGADSKGPAATPNFPSEGKRLSIWFWLLLTMWSILGGSFVVALILTLDLWFPTRTGPAVAGGEQRRNQTASSILWALVAWSAFFGLMILLITLFSLWPEGPGKAPAPAGADERRIFPTFPWIIVGFLVSLVLLMWAAFIQIRLPTYPEQNRFRWELIHSLALEIGIAFFTSCFIAVTLEWFMHERAEAEHQEHVKRIEKKVFDAVFGFNVDNKLLTEIYDSVNRSKFMRREATLLFEFDALSQESKQRQPPPADDLLLTRVTVSYRLHNATRIVQDWEMKPYFENPLPASADDAFVSCYIGGCDIPERGDARCKPWELSPCELCTQYDPNGIRRWLKVGTMQIRPGEDASIRYTYQTIKRMSDNHSWLTVHPTEGLRVYATVVDPKLDLEFHAESVHRNEANRICPESHASRTHEWRIEPALLPFQGIILYWFPKPKPEQVQRSAARVEEHRP